MPWRVNMTFVEQEMQIFGWPHFIVEYLDQIPDSAPCTLFPPPPPPPPPSPSQHLSFPIQ